MTATTDLMGDLAIPYVVVVYSVESDGGWVRRAEYPELPGCFAEAASAKEAMEKLDAIRVRMIVEMHQRGEHPPRPRPPLLDGLATGTPLDLDTFLGELLQGES